MIRVYAVYDAPILLGRQGEHDMREVVFDLKDWINDYGEGYAQLAVHRHGEEDYYLVPLLREGRTAVWRVAAADVGVVGQSGACELSWMSNDGAFVKSETWRTTVLEALNGDEIEVPEVSKAWLDAAREESSATQKAAAEAKTAAEEAEAAAKKAQDAAANASGGSNSGSSGVADGVSPTVEMVKADGVTTLTITDVNGQKTVEILDGEDGAPFTYDMFTAEQLAALTGPKGDPGDTPVKGEDYFTEADKTELKKELAAELDTGVMTVNGNEPDENGNIEIEAGTSATLTDLTAVLSGTTLTITETLSDESTQEITVELDENSVPVSMTVGGTTVPVSMEGF